MTIIDGPNWCLWLVTTFEHVTFSPPLLSILVFQPILFHTIVTKGHYMLCSIEKFFVFFLKSRACRAVDCGVANDMSKVTHVLVCIVFTPCFCFASSVCFGSFEKYLSLSGFARDWCRFPSRRQPSGLLIFRAVAEPRISSKILRCASYFQLSSRCLDIPMKHCRSYLIYELLAPHDWNIDSHALSLLTILYCVYKCRYGLH